MNEALQTYMADHLAGAVHAIELVKNLQDKYQNETLGQFAGSLLEAIEADKNILEDLAKQIGGGPSTVKDTISWAAEKFSRLKLRHGDEESLGMFESLEHLALGIQGKLALWRALAVIAAAETRLQGPDYERLARRAREQHEAVEEKRLELAPKALRFKES
jgi:hypothetical protein